MRWLFAVLIVMSVLLGSRGEARAAIVRDGQTLAIDLSEARICFIAPQELHNDEDCAGLPTNITPPADAKVTHLAAGIARVRGGHSNRILALVHAYRIESAPPLTRELTADNVSELTALILKNAPELPAGLTRRPLITRLEKSSENVPVVRITMLIDGYEPPSENDDGPPQGHIEIVGIPTVDGTYFIEWMGTQQNGLGLMHLADAAVPTIHVDSAKMLAGAVTPSSLTLFGFSVFAIGVGFAVAIVFVMAAFALLRGKGQRRLVSFHEELWPPHDDDDDS